MDEYVFKRPIDKYNSIDISPTDEYIKQMSYLVARDKQIPLEKAKDIVVDILNSSDITNPLVKYKYRTSNGDMIVKEDTLEDYIKDVKDSGDVIVPSFTTYKHPSVQKSIHANFLSINIARRKDHKHAEFKYKQLGDVNQQKYNNVMQKVLKIFNNSLSGAYASKSTTLFNPSAHYTLTSITRSVASIGNAITESLVAGNKLFYKPEIVYSYISSIISNCKQSVIEYAIDKYKLHIPTPDEVYKSIMYSTKYYWSDDIEEAYIHQLLCKLSGYELAAILYTNDLWHLRMHNEELVKTMLTNMSKKVTGITNDPIYLKKAPEGIANMVHIICANDIKGMDVDYDKLVGTETLTILASTAKNTIEQLAVYKVLFRTFFTTEIMPTSIAYVKDMIRDSIVLSDTDSTCGSYDMWIKWYYGNIRFSEEATALSAAVMTINTQVMDHNIKIFAKNMNVDNNLVELLKMKNEFFWSVFIAANVNKHYFADTLIQEGNVYKNPEIEIKGVHFIGSAANQDIVSKTVSMMKEILYKISNNEKISILEYVTKVADMERELHKKILSGNIDIYKLEKIKEPNSYKDEPTKSPYINHILWDTVFADKYGNAGKPTYNVIKIPTVINSKKDFELFISNISDVDIKDKLSNFVTKYNKDIIRTFRLPVSIISTAGVPVELHNIIDYKGIILDNLTSARLVLESIGFYTKVNTELLMDMGY